MATVAIIGRPNVGKSSLFNRIIGERKSIEAAEAGTTRDRVYGTLDYEKRRFTFIDVAGVLATEGDVFSESAHEQVKLAQDEADMFLLVVDVQTGVQKDDLYIADELRKLGKPVVVVANKADNRQLESQMYEFAQFGFKHLIASSTIHNVGVGDLLDTLISLSPAEKPNKSKQEIIKVALVGRPNVGKSSLLNLYAGTNRAIVSDVAGTTRDAIDLKMPYKETIIQFIDTAGIRRAGKVEVGVEKFSVMRSIHAIEESDIAVVLIDAVAGPTAGDARIAGIADELGKGIILAVNKWDAIGHVAQNMQHETEAEIKDLVSSAIVESDEIAQRKFLSRLQTTFAYLPWAPVVFISAKTGLHSPKLLEQLRKVYANRQIMLEQEILDSVKKAAEATHSHLPLIYSLKQIDTNPPHFELQVNRPQTWHFSQSRFIENLIREAEPFIGTPIKVELAAYKKSNKNN